LTLEISELDTIVGEDFRVNQNAKINGQDKRSLFLMGKVMDRVRGKIGGQKVAQTLKEKPKILT
jgi:Asp-tRNA(Asn)/Glu-tRNA(Gln) amidotransferase B subunit